MGSTGGRHSEECDSSDAILNYLSQNLMDEGLENGSCMFPDAALQAAEKSFYEVLGEKYPFLINQMPSHHDYAESPVNNGTGFRNCCGCKSSTVVHANNAIESNSVSDLSKQKSCCVLAPPGEYTFLSNSWPSLQSFSPAPSNFRNTATGLVDPDPLYAPLAPGSVSQRKSLLQCMDAMKETRSLLPRGNHRNLHIENSRLIRPQLMEKNLVVDVAAKDQGKRDYPSSGMETKKITSVINLSAVSERRLEHLAVYDEATEQREMFDKTMLFNREGDGSAVCTHKNLQNGRGRTLSQSGKQRERGGGATSKKENVKKRDLVDLRSLLMHCAEAVAGNDLRSAHELLLQIRQHSSPLGDGSQRVAHCFVNALEARLVGRGSEAYTELAAKLAPSFPILKPCRSFLSACPFMRMSNFFATQTIMDLSRTATKLHIIHFGILYGFQWAGLIQHLSERPGGPPALRITGLEHPYPGIRTAAIMEEAGRRLSDYCERFNVPFEYNAIAQKWDTVQFEDLEIIRDEVLVVYCSCRFRHLLDETVLLSSPRDTVLKLIKRINPDVFIHEIINGSYNAPFFVTRFREALHHFSAVFDMFEANSILENHERRVLEQEIYGNQILNVVACEGEKRVERPETYKQWQLRNLRTGLRQLPLNEDIMKIVKAQVKLCYHKDFLVDEDNQWMLQGWKGRILFAISCWKTA